MPDESENPKDTDPPSVSNPFFKSPVDDSWKWVEQFLLLEWQRK